MQNENESSRTEGRASAGYRHKRVREVHSLPLGWRHLTQVDVQHLADVIDKRSGKQADLRTLEGCALAWSSLVTGRKPAELIEMSVRMVRRGAHLQAESPGLISRGGKWGWWLAAANARQKATNGHMCPTSDFVYLPATAKVSDMIKRCIALRRSQSRGQVHISGEAKPLFSTGHPLLEDVTKLLEMRHPVGPDRTRRATSTLESIARWLPAELVGLPGGDVVPASLIIGHVPTVAETSSYYGAVSQQAVLSRYKAAVSAIDKPSHEDVPGQVLSTFLGDRLTPSDATVRAMVAELAAALDDRTLNLAERHLAMTRFTVTLLAFALAHRGKNTMPARSAVHGDTGFCWIREKAIRGVVSKRLVWVCGIAARQLELYESHLDHVIACASESDADAVRALRSGEHLALFDLTSGQVIPVRLLDALRDAVERFGLRENSGRHWLRAKLLGQCSTETLQALYGHGPLRDGSWDATSTLDPVVYRADLARALDPVLGGVGWAARSLAIAS